ncbi:hypothetical protein A1O1_06086 [Capronia coronata CBS 617.96]|uniref:TauD/TfdA-like domain-containing protein n=1 Tax=Capronia coronata CBS 617.96 TaxID=1182541 RepID=W9XZP9_9EURO|nr:uncharacterized protein A1O1_06086 [Capronia coronata CBS 617.96]EXJ85718.1 hypothetical protein A1O1_06086 [Capronia coronata CBS 617.96]
MSPPIAIEPQSAYVPSTFTKSPEVAVKVTALPVNKDVEERPRPSPKGYYDSLELFPRVHEESYAEMKAENYPYLDLLPHSPKGIHPPLKEVPHSDVGLRADPAMPNLLKAPGAVFKEMTPGFGSEVHGIQLSQMTNAQKDELALMVAKRGLLVFRDQDLKDQGPAKMLELGEHFGPLHTHQFGDMVKGYAGLTAVYRDQHKKLADAHVAGNVSSINWHTDMSYEINTVGTTFLMHMTGPPSGGDTIYASMTKAFSKLSPAFQEFLSTLSAVHSGHRQFSKAKTATGLIRETIETIHPVVRTHPVTGEKALWVNPTYTSEIVGLKEEESEAILRMLFLHTQMGQDFHVRVHWEPGTVVVYDNRITQHSALLDFEPGPGIRRHLIRITPQAERPFY